MRRVAQASSLLKGLRMTTEVRIEDRTRSPIAAGLNLAVIGAGPVGLALALKAAQTLPTARVIDDK